MKDAVQLMTKKYMQTEHVDWLMRSPWSIDHELAGRFRRLALELQQAEETGRAINKFISLVEAGAGRESAQTELAKLLPSPAPDAQPSGIEPWHLEWLERSTYAYDLAAATEIRAMVERKDRVTYSIKQASKFLKDLEAGVEWKTALGELQRAVAFLATKPREERANKHVEGT